MAEDTRYISRSRRFVLLLIAWLLTAIATIPGTVFVPYLPVGLGRPFGEQAVMASVSGWYILFGWPVYIGLTIAAYCSRRRWIYYIVYIVLCLLLAYNCVGCREMMRDIGSIKG
jgi:hypothetical protein